MKISAIIFDWKRTLYDPDSKILVAGAEELLATAQGLSIPLYLIGKGGEDMYAETKRLGIENYFTKIVFEEGAKEESLFVPFISSDPSTTVFIGDRIQSELAVGKSLGATTIWVRQGKFATEMPLGKDQEPDYIVASLYDAKELLTKTLG